MRTANAKPSGIKKHKKPQFSPKASRIKSAQTALVKAQAVAMGRDNDGECSLKETQKKQIIARLNGYCVQESFESIISRLAPCHRKTILLKLTTAFLFKLVVEEFFDHPSWYAEIPPEHEDRCARTPWKGVTPDGAVFEKFLSKFEGVNPEYSRLWRCTTSRIFHALYPEVEDNPKFVQALKARREARCRSLAKETLAIKSFQHLLKPTTSTEQDLLRKQGLGACLFKVAEIAVAISTQNPVLKFKTLHELEPRFDHLSEEVEADHQHRLDDGDPRLDGHHVLFIYHPFVYRMENDFEPEDTIRVAKAVAVMEKDCSASSEDSETIPNVTGETVGEKTSTSEEKQAAGKTKKTAKKTKRKTTG
ncbi:hypothetical protein BJX99DRAFT_257999 [Aspergillus californicus]